MRGLIRNSQLPPPKAFTKILGGLRRWQIEPISRCTQSQNQRWAYLTQGQRNGSLPKLPYPLQSSTTVSHQVCTHTPMTCHFPECPPWLPNLPCWVLHPVWAAQPRHPCSTSACSSRPSGSSPCPSKSQGRIMRQRKGLTTAAAFSFPTSPSGQASSGFSGLGS